eukprot:7509068-Alexandrium_andersonii.AAC.1
MEPTSSLRCRPPLCPTGPRLPSPRRRWNEPAGGSDHPGTHPTRHRRGRAPWTARPPRQRRGQP